MRFIGFAIVLVIPTVHCAGNGDEVAKEFKALEGKWRAVAMEAVGKPFPADRIPDFSYVVAANGKATGKSFQGEYQATIIVDLKKNPKTIDNLHETGAQKGKKQYGIYKLEGGKWTVCMTRPGAAESERPKDFNTKGTTSVLFVFERTKEDKKP